MNTFFAAVHESVHGTTRHSAVRGIALLTQITDIGQANLTRFTSARAIGPIGRTRSVGRIVIRRLGREDGGLRLRLQSALRGAGTDIVTRMVT